MADPQQIRMLAVVWAVALPLAILGALSSSYPLPAMFLMAAEGLIVGVMWKRLKRYIGSGPSS